MIHSVTNLPDCFRGKKGLSKTCSRVVVAVGDSALTAAEIMERAEIATRMTVSRSLRALVEAGLFEKTGKRWRRTSKTFAEVAAERDLTGYTEKLVEDYRTQSKAHAAEVRNPSGKVKTEPKPEEEQAAAVDREHVSAPDPRAAEPESEAALFHTDSREDDSRATRPLKLVTPRRGVAARDERPPVKQAAQIRLKKTKGRGMSNLRKRLRQGEQR
jgi:hypothetical protein